MYSTDNGAEKFTWPDGGQSPFRGEKNTNWEGGWRVPIFVRLGNRGRAQAVPTPEHLREISISDIVATGADGTSSISGIPGYPVRGVTLSIRPAINRPPAAAAIADRS